MEVVLLSFSAFQLRFGACRVAAPHGAHRYVYMSALLCPQQVNMGMIARVRARLQSIHSVANKPDPTRLQDDTYQSGEFNLAMQ